MHRQYVRYSKEWDDAMTVLNDILIQMGYSFVVMAKGKCVVNECTITIIM